MLTRTFKNLLATIAFGTMVLTTSGAQAEEVKVPETVADHEALAKTYQEKAASYKKEAEWHKAMAEAYAKRHPDRPRTGRNPWNVKMQKHCRELGRTAEKFAVQAQKAADFHDLRAKELQGK